MNRLALPSRMASTRVIAVLRAPRAGDLRPIVDALVQGGVVSIEVTLTTPDALEELPRLLAEFGGDAEFGVGTVTDADAAHAAVDAGAHYLVTPHALREAIDAGVARGVPVLAGALTPTEIHGNWVAGASAVKVFPAGLVGPSYAADIHGPFPQIPLVPSGGVDLDSARAWIRAGSPAVSVGGPLLQDAFSGGDLSALTARARRFREVVAR